MLVSRRLHLWLLAAYCAATPLRALNIQFDFSYDSLGFFSDPLRKSTLEAAARSWEEKLAGAQTPAIPLGTGGNTWTLSFNRPDHPASLGGANTSIVNKPLPANTIVIYVGARPDVYGGYLGYAEFNYHVSGSSAWVKLIQDRNTGTRFASFGGAIAFDSDASWYFDSDPGSKENFPNQTDFYTLAMHEIGHLLGFTYGAAAFSRQALGGKFHGVRVVALNGGAPELGIGGHWQAGLQFQGKPMVMAPHLAWNERAWINPLDAAVLHDLGYVAETGVRVTLNPPAAAGAGARWRLDDGAWHQSGETLLGRTPGEGVISFKTPASYLPPEAMTVEVKDGEVVELMVDFVPVPAPVVQAAPQPVLALAGATARLRVDAEAGGAPLQFRWRKGGKLLAKADGPVLHFSALKPGDGGWYDVQVSSAGGSAPSLAAAVGVVGAVSGPEVIHEEGTLRLKQAATGPALGYQWHWNDQLLRDDPELGISGAATSQLQIIRASPTHDGTYYCRVRMSDGDGGCVEQAGPVKTVKVLPRPVIAGQTLGPWRVSGLVSEQIIALNEPARFQVNGLPPGVRLDRATGRLSGRPLAPGPFRLRVTASNAAGVSAPREFLVPCAALEPNWQGRFSGLVARGTLSENLGGLLQLDVQHTGAVSGRLSLGKHRFPLRGVLDTLPGPDATMLLLVTRKPTPLRLEARIRSTDGHLTGTLLDATAPSLAVEAWQSAWHARQRPAHAFAGELATALLPAAPTVLEMDEESILVPVAPEEKPIPEGAGYATAKVSPAGVVTWSGRLADGTPHTQSAALSAHGRIPLHALLYQGGGSAQGWAVLSARTDAAPENELDGHLVWRKCRPANARDRAHAEGFPDCEVAVIGGTRQPREAVVTQLALPPDETNNAMLSLHGAGLDEAEMGADTVIAITISSTNKAFPPPVEDNPAAMRLTRINTATNLFTGGFTLRDEDPDTGAQVVRQARFQGLLVPRLRQGLGWFLLPQLTPEKTAPLRSGLVLLQGSALASE